MYIYRFIRGFFENRKYQKILHRAYEEEELIRKMSYMLGSQLSVDWIGRLYTVINPNIRDGKYNPEQIYEINVDGDANNSEYVLRWIMQKLDMVRGFITNNNLFDMLTYKFEPLGNDNYLLIIQPITLQPLLRNAKRALYELAGLGAASGAGYFLYQLLW